MLKRIHATFHLFQIVNNRLTVTTMKGQSSKVYQLLGGGGEGAYNCDKWAIQNKISPFEFSILALH